MRAPNLGHSARLEQPSSGPRRPDGAARSTPADIAAGLCVPMFAWTAPDRRPT